MLHLSRIQRITEQSANWPRKYRRVDGLAHDLQEKAYCPRYFHVHQIKAASTPDSGNSHNASATGGKTKKADSQIDLPINDKHRPSLHFVIDAPDVFSHQPQG